MGVNEVVVIFRSLIMLSKSIMIPHEVDVHIAHKSRHPRTFALVAFDHDAACPHGGRCTLSWLRSNPPPYEPMLKLAFHSCPLCQCLGGVPVLLRECTNTIIDAHHVMPPPQPRSKRRPSSYPFLSTFRCYTDECLLEWNWTVLRAKMK